MSDLIQLGTATRIVVSETGQYAGNFDRACVDAHKMALSLLGSDGNGHLKKVACWERSRCRVEVVFAGCTIILGMTGVEYVYNFDVTPWANEDYSK